MQKWLYRQLSAQASLQPAQHRPSRQQMQKWLHRQLSAQASLQPAQDRPSRKQIEDRLPKMGSGGCRSTKASLLCCFVSTAAAAIVRMALHRPERGLTCLTLLNGALPDDVGSAAAGSSARLCIIETAMYEEVLDTFITLLLSQVAVLRMSRPPAVSKGPCMSTSAAYRCSLLPE